MLRALNISEADAAPIPFYKAVGCDQCNHTGYRGRIGIYEVMRVTDKLRRLIAAACVGRSLRDAALAGGMISLGEDGLAKVKSGITTPRRNCCASSPKCARCARCARGAARRWASISLACPQCGKRLSGGCPHCGRALQPGWNFCPYCARTTESRRAGKKLQGRESANASCLPPTWRNSRRGSLPNR